MSRPSRQPLATHLMRAAAGPHLTLYVEGDDDRRFWLARVLPSVSVDVRGSKAAVIAALAAHRDIGTLYVIGVVDADFERVAAGGTHVPAPPDGRWSLETVFRR